MSVPALPSPHHSSGWLTKQGRNTNVSLPSNPLDERKHVFILKEEKKWIHTDWPLLPPNSKSVLMIKPWAGVINGGLVARIRGKLLFLILEDELLPEYPTCLGDHSWIMKKEWAICRNTQNTSMWHVTFTNTTELPAKRQFLTAKELTTTTTKKHINLVQYSLVLAWGDENSHPARAKSMITQVHGTERGGTHINSDQTGWQTCPLGMPSSTHS